MEGGRRGGEIGNGGVEGRLVLKTHRPDQTRRGLSTLRALELDGRTFLSCLAV